MNFHTNLLTLFGMKITKLINKKYIVIVVGRGLGIKRCCNVTNVCNGFMKHV